MAAPTATSYINPVSYGLVVTGTNVDAGNNDYHLNYFAAGLQKGFSIVTGTLTAMTVTVLGWNITAAKAVDITNDIFGVTALASDKGYACDVPLPYQNLIIRAARSNATNAVDLEIFAPKR